MLTVEKPNSYGITWWCTHSSAVSLSSCFDL